MDAINDWERNGILKKSEAYLMGVLLQEKSEPFICQNIFNGTQFSDAASMTWFVKVPTGVEINVMVLLDIYSFLVCSVLYANTWSS